MLGKIGIEVRQGARVSSGKNNRLMRAGEVEGEGSGKDMEIKEKRETVSSRA